MTRKIDRELILKLETFNPVGSFKGRGSDFFMRGVGPDTQVECASAGNFGRNWSARWRRIL
jgi:threonine dehydratase